MLPYVRDRPLALQVFPDGIDGKGFFMKAVPDYFPDWVERVTVPKRGGTVTHALANNAATTVYLAGQNVVTPHLWLSRQDEPRKPDRLIMDFDPSPGGGFADVRAAARDAGERLRDRGLATYAMVTGSRGIHVVCPLRRGPGFGDVHKLARAVAEEMVADDPKRLTLEYKKVEPRLEDLRGREPQRLRPARGGAIRGAGEAAGAGRHADPLGRAERLQAQARPVDGEDDRRPYRLRGRSLEGDRRERRRALPR